MRHHNFGSGKSALLSVLVAASTLLACKVFQSSEQKVCSKLESLREEAGKDAAKDPKKCVAAMAVLKQKDPEQFECLSECVPGASDEAAAVKCSSTCAGGSSAKTSSASVASKAKPSNRFIDKLSQSSLKSNLAKGYNMKVVDQRKSGSSSIVSVRYDYTDIYMFRVMLKDVSSAAEGKRVFESLKSASSSKAHAGGYGNQKVLFVSCVARRKKGSSKTLDCSRYYSSAAEKVYSAAM